MKSEWMKAVEAAWNSRAKAQGLRPKSVSYKKVELEFAVGAMAAASALLPAGECCSPPSWVINAMRGEPIFEVAL